MNKKDIKKWTNALRSGRYQQGKSFLNYQNKYCCLGVACDIFIPKNKIKRDVNGDIYGKLPVDQLAAPSWLKRFKTRFSADTEMPLTGLNDGYDQYTFDEIADLLEAVYIHDVLKTDGKNV